MYGRGTYAPQEYRKWLAARIKPLIRAHGLERGREDPATGGVRSTALGMLRDDEGERRPKGSVMRTGGPTEAPDAASVVSASLTGLGVQPTLF